MLIALARLLPRLGALVALGVLLGNAASAATASNTMPSVHAVKITQAITANSLKPAACTMNLVDVLAVPSSPGTQAGTSGNDLILGGPGNDTLGKSGAGNGSDCCLGGGGNNSFKGSCTVTSDP
jgi:hypothetical protein